MRYRLRTLLILALANVACLPLYCLADEPTTDPALVGHWRADITREIDGKPGDKATVFWHLHANGTAAYPTAGQWAVIRRDGDKRIVRCTILGQVAAQTFVLQGPDRFKLILEQDENGKEIMKGSDYQGGGWTFNRIKE